MPVVWALTGSRVGDNQQVLQFTGALGLEVREVPLVYGALRMVPNWLMGASLASVAGDARRELQGPWPDLIVGAGQRSVPVARWVQQQSGGKTKIVFLGRPRAPLSWFDLVVTTPQYGLPAAPNVVQVLLPFVAPVAAPDDLAHWVAAWGDLARPMTAVLVGSSHSAQVLDQRSIDGVVALAQRISGDGSVIFSTSPRTSAEEVGMLTVAAEGVGQVLRWTKGEPNPHLSLLDQADRFVVTEDSVSMIAEAVSTGKPVHVVELTRRASLNWRADDGVMGALARCGVLSPPRDVRRLVEMLAANGVVEYAGAVRGDGGGGGGDFAEWPEVIERVRGLVKTTSSSSRAPSRDPEA